MPKYEEYYYKAQDAMFEALQAAYKEGYEDGLRKARAKTVRVKERRIKTYIPDEATYVALYKMGRKAHGEE